MDSMIKKNTEIEKKYLVSYLPERFYAYDHTELEQAYISFGDVGESEKRVRLMRTGESERYFYTEKSDGTLARDEYEMEITKREYRSLCASIISKFVKKARYYIPVKRGELMAELDVYHGELTGLVTVEVEFPSLEEAEAFAPPSWFGKDITEDKRYKNKNLARNGRPESNEL